jgi:hypothetical protein
VLACEHQHKCTHVAGGAEVEAGITRPPLQAGDINLITTNLPPRHIEKLRCCFAPHIEDQILEARFSGGHALRLQGKALHVLKGSEVTECRIG